jgi:Fuc2NAc and GlcNAc transferase
MAAAATFLLSVLLCGGYLRFAKARQILDLPNDRSSHLLPTPHGGGIALLSAFFLGLLLAAWLRGAWEESFILLAGVAGILMLLGIVDDVKNLSVRVRLVVYTLMSLWVANTLVLVVASGVSVPDAVLVLLATLIMLWALNLFNFMDGIDGIAAIQTVLACCGAALLSWLTIGESDYASFCLLLAAAHAGFLIWNWPPAKLFMGDAGSVPTGFLLAALALLGGMQGAIEPLCWLILLAAFITDATWTLLWRICTGQTFTQPHRLHAYQRLSRYWGSHIKVDVVLILINLLWLFPLALLLQLWPHHYLILVILAYLPLLCGMVKIGRVA